MEKQWQTLFSWAPKSLQMVTAAMKLKDACSLEEKLWKSRDITLPAKVHLVKAMVFPVVMYGYESWTIKKAEHEELKLLNCGVGEDSWETSRTPNQSILKASSPEYSLKGLMLKLKLQYCGYLMQRADSLEKTLMLGGIGAGREEGREGIGAEDEMAGWHHRLDGHEFE